MIGCKHCGEQPQFLRNENGNITGELAHACYVIGKEVRCNIDEWDVLNDAKICCGTCKNFAKKLGSEKFGFDGVCTEWLCPVPSDETRGIHGKGVNGILCDKEHDTKEYASWQPMTKAQFYLTKERAPYLTIQSVVGILDGIPDVDVKVMYYKGQHVVTIARDDFEEWLENEHYVTKGEWESLKAQTR